MRRIMWATWVGAMAAVAAPAYAADTGERALETNLLHRQVSLGGLTSYSRERGTWLPLPPSKARVLVVNLWARTCTPCLVEMKALSKLAADWRQKDSRNVQFLFVADPPDQTSAAEVASFWQSPYVDELAGPRCPGTNIVRANRPSCLLDVPDVDPARSVRNGLAGAVTSESRPVTLLLDAQGTVRQVFAGSIEARQAELSTAIERLLGAVQRRAASGAQ